MIISAKKKENKPIPTQLNERDFNLFILPHLSMPKRGPDCKISYHSIFNYILKVLYTSMQWKELPIKIDKNGKPEIHYSNVYKKFSRWSNDGSLDNIFSSSVVLLANKGILDSSILHGDGSNTVAKKGGDLISYSGHKHQRGEKVLALVDKNGYIISPYTIAPVNRNDCILLPNSLSYLSQISRKIGFSIKGSILNLDGVFDSKRNRKCIFNLGMLPNIPENKRNRKKPKPGPKRFFNEEIHKLRLTVERVFAWEDKFKRLLLRFERIQLHHFSFKLIAYTLINIRKLCSSNNI